MGDELGGTRRGLVKAALPLAVPAWGVSLPLPPGLSAGIEAGLGAGRECADIKQLVTVEASDTRDDGRSLRLPLSERPTRPLPPVDYRPELFGKGSSLRVRVSELSPLRLRVSARWQAWHR
jgi:hypothetical protein